LLILFSISWARSLEEFTPAPNYIFRKKRGG